MNDPHPEGHMASYIERRKFLATLGGAAAAWPLAARAQQAERPARIGFLRPSPAPQRGLAAFRSGLADNGFVAGRNYDLVTRWGGGSAEHLEEFAAGLVEKPGESDFGCWLVF